MWKKWSVVLLVLCLLCAACTQNAPEGTATNGTGTAFPVQATDLMGQTVTVNSAPQKIVSLSPSTTEILFALGLGEKVIGVDDMSNYPEKAAETPQMGDYNGPNVELIASAQADLILAGNTLQSEAITALQALNVPVAGVEAQSLAQIYDSILLIGTLTGADTQAQNLVAELKQKEQSIAELAKKLPNKPKVYYVMSFGEFGNWTCGSGTMIDDYITLCGGVNIAHDGGAPWMDFSLEKVVEGNPDILLLDSNAGTVEQLAAEQSYAQTAAVANSHVFVLPADVISRPGPRMAEAMEQIYNAIAAVAAP